MGLATIIDLQDDMEVVGQADDGAEAIRVYEQVKPTVTLMDLRLPNGNGTETTETLVKSSNANILVLTTFAGSEEIYRALQAGAKGYLLKNVSAEALFNAIRTVHQGRRCIPEDVASILASRIYTADLTSREIEVLQLLVKGESNKEIGAVLNISPNTTKFHLKSIMTKLNVRDRTEAATVALQRGIVPFRADKE